MRLPTLILLTFFPSALFVRGLPVNSGGPGGGDNSPTDDMPPKNQERRSRYRPWMEALQEISGQPPPRPADWPWPEMVMIPGEYQALLASHRRELAELRPDELKYYERCVKRYVCPNTSVSRAWPRALAGFLRPKTLISCWKNEKPGYSLEPLLETEPWQLWALDGCLRRAVYRSRGVNPRTYIYRHETRRPEQSQHPPQGFRYRPQPGDAQGPTSTPNDAETEGGQESPEIMQFSDNVRGRVKGIVSTISKAWEGAMGADGRLGASGVPDAGARIRSGFGLVKGLGLAT